MKTSWRSLCLAAAIAVGWASGCDKASSEAGGDGAKAAAGSPLLPTTLFLNSAPGGAKDVIAAKKGAKEGARIVVHGRIGGSKEPFTDGRAIFTIMDLGLAPCGPGKMDSCPTPWDYCCDPRDEITKNIATVQVVGAEGAPIRADLKGVKGIQPLAEVFVSGKVAKADNGGLVISADGIFTAGK